ncbi:MAG: hypothetical protein ABIV48_05925 [Pyrinomonadaceae bacterium]
MKNLIKKFGVFAAIIIISIISTVGAMGQTSTSHSSTDKKVVADFEKRAKKYIKLRDKAARRIPTPSKDATPEQVAAYKTSLQKAVEKRREHAKQGEIFTPAAAELIRRLIKANFKGYDRAELRQTVLEADTKGIPLKVNFEYPESKELIEMSPALLLTLHQIPPQLRYRYIGRSLVLLDRDTALIVDFMKEALP